MMMMMMMMDQTRLALAFSSPQTSGQGRQSAPWKGLLRNGKGTFCEGHLVLLASKHSPSPAPESTSLPWVPSQQPSPAASRGSQSTSYEGGGGFCSGGLYSSSWSPPRDQGSLSRGTGPRILERSKEGPLQPSVLLTTPHHPFPCSQNLQEGSQVCSTPALIAWIFRPQLILSEIFL